VCDACVVARLPIHTSSEPLVSGSGVMVGVGGAKVDHGWWWLLEIFEEEDDGGHGGFCVLINYMKNLNMLVNIIHKFTYVICKFTYAIRKFNFPISVSDPK